MECCGRDSYTNWNTPTRRRINVTVSDKQCSTPKCRSQNSSSVMTIFIISVDVNKLT